MLTLLRERNFRLFWIGEAVSLIGDQFHMIALPWLVLRITGDAFAMGTVLAMAGIPRAIFMLVGGAVTDRFSAKTLMLGSNLLRMLLVGILAGLVIGGGVQLWMLYGLALIFGLVDAFFFPASATMVPRLTTADQLQTGNAIYQGTATASLFLGPVLAGVLIALFGQGTVNPQTGEAIPELTGIGLAFAFDTLTFLVSAISLWLIRMPPGQEEASTEQRQNVLAAIWDGLRVIWQDATLRTLFGISAAINFFVAGPFSIGIPVLADSRFPQGAAAFGLIMSAWGGGMLVGTILAGTLPKPGKGRLGWLLTGVVAILGVDMILLGWAPTVWVAVTVTSVAAVANGYANIVLVTWLQTRVPAQMLGRLMSFAMFMGVGLYPLSAAIAGAVVAWNPLVMFVGAGVLICGVAVVAGTRPQMREIGLTNED